MNTQAIPPQLDLRLTRLNQEIHEGLVRIRRHIHELEEAEQKAPAGGPRDDFAALLARSLEQGRTRSET